jgi:hypothetical protein
MWRKRTRGGAVVNEKYGPKIQSADNGKFKRIFTGV